MARAADRTRTTAGAWLGHPATLAAIAVLLVNDHLLKRLWPGVVTGKLSDVAGMLVAPPLLALAAALAVRRLGAAQGSASRSGAGAPGEADRRAALAAILLTAVVFTVVKTTAAGARAAADVWALFIPSARVVADPSDLLALPALGLAWLVRLRAVATVARVRRALRRARLLVALPAAVLAVTATSAADPGPSALHVEAHDAVIVVYLNPSSRGTGLATSDQGRTWHRWDTSATGTPRTVACVPDRPSRCYRVVPHRLAVEQSDNAGATWSPAWAVSPGRQLFLDRRHHDDYLYGGIDPAASVAVAVLPVPAGHLVAVANGSEGVALRDAAGRWHRLGFDGRDDLSEQTAALVSDPGENIQAETGTAVLAALTVLLAALASAGLWRRSPVGFAVLGLLVWAGVYLMVKGPPGIFGLPYAAFGFLLAASAAAGLAGIGVHAGLRGLSVIVAAPLTFAAIYLPFLGWSAGWPDDYGTAVVLAIALCLLALAAGAHFAVRARGGYRRMLGGLRARTR
ncbi:hypothetical protein [Microbispora sp. H13382]|uniref:hypothetical protein n=1 Tax=Microbispora sp. H13382 TaxID=2729112 RepID=UPI0015FECF03|nr:hypothetical protein [Microbispora sp. H13382]